MGIALAKLKNMPKAHLAAMLLSLEPFAPGSSASAPPLLPSQAQLLADLCPTSMELRALQDWAGARAKALASQPAPQDAAGAKLGEAEGAWLELGRCVPQQMRERAQALSFRCNFAERVEEVAARVQALLCGAQELRACAPLQRIVGTAVKLVEKIPAAAAAAPPGGGFILLSWAAAFGARVPGLPQRDPRGTLLHVLAAVTQQQGEAFHPATHTPALCAAVGNVDFTLLPSDLAALDAGVRQYAGFLGAAAGEGEGGALQAEAAPLQALPAAAAACAMQASVAGVRASFLAAQEALAAALAAYPSVATPHASAPAPGAKLPAAEEVFSAVVSFATALKKCQSAFFAAPGAPKK